MLGAFREYLNLCSEEMWLHKNRRIDRQTWTVWEHGMRQVARFPSFLEAWQVLSVEYEYYGDFQRFVSQNMISYANQADRYNKVNQSTVEPGSTGDD